MLIVRTVVLGEQCCRSPWIASLEKRISASSAHKPYKQQQQAQVWEVRSSRRVTFSDTCGPEEVLEAVHLFGGVLAGLGIDIEALKSTLRSPPSTQQSDLGPTGRLLAQEYHERTKKMEQLQKKLQTGRGRVSRATEELNENERGRETA